MTHEAVRQGVGRWREMDQEPSTLVAPGVVDEDKALLTELASRLAAEATAPWPGRERRPHAPDADRHRRSTVDVTGGGPVGSAYAPGCSPGTGGRPHAAAVGVVTGASALTWALLGLRWRRRLVLGAVAGLGFFAPTLSWLTDFHPAGFAAVLQLEAALFAGAMLLVDPDRERCGRPRRRWSR